MTNCAYGGTIPVNSYTNQLYYANRKIIRQIWNHLSFIRCKYSLFHRVVICLKGYKNIPNDVWHFRFGSGTNELLLHEITALACKCNVHDDAKF